MESDSDSDTESDSDSMHIGADRTIALYLVRSLIVGHRTVPWLPYVADHTLLTVCVCDIKIYVAPILLLKVFTHSQSRRRQ